VYFATIGIIGGTSQLIGGVILDFTADFSGTFLSYTYNPFTPIFILGLLWLVASSVIFQHVRSDTDVSGRQFAGLFLRGNPVRAFESMFGYYRAKDERAAVTMTERLGHAHSPLTVDELLEALIDPRFNVRFEAIISIARTNPDPRFVEALEQILHGTELALSAMAAWALGRIGDSQAMKALRKGLDSEYRSIRAQCARSLGTLGDESVAQLLHERLTHETDKGLQMAYASALGSLATRNATGTLLDLLAQTENEGARMDLALSLMRIIGDEHRFIRILRQIRQDPGTATAQSLEAIKRNLTNMENLFDECIDLWAHDDLQAGSSALAGVIRQLPESVFDSSHRQVLEHCATQMQANGFQRPEYLILALAILDAVGDNHQSS
jgi:HEAT repeat protein